LGHRLLLPILLARTTLAGVGYSGVTYWVGSYMSTGELHERISAPHGLGMTPGSTLIPGAVTVTVMSWEAPSHPRQ
jgi:hypothetical protein